jgi:hypothetical protein
MYKSLGVTVDLDSWEYMRWFTSGGEADLTVWDRHERPFSVAVQVVSPLSDDGDAVEYTTLNEVQEFDA